jgi:tetratricopeptide (TPR) repeat protein
LATIQHALVLDPLSLIVGAMHGQFLYHAGTYSEAVERFEATLGMESRFWVGQICAAKVYEKLGRYSDALTACDRAWEFSLGNSEALSLAGYVHAVSGNTRQAEAKVNEMIELTKTRYVPPYNVALVFAGLKETKMTLYWLAQAFEQRDVHMPFLLDHKWDGIRSNQQFQEILSRVGFIHG